MEHTLIARIRNDPSSLTRVVSLLRRRGYEIQSLSVERPDAERGRRATLVVSAADVRQLTAQLRRCIDVLDLKLLMVAGAGAGLEDDHARVASA